MKAKDALISICENLQTGIRCGGSPGVPTSSPTITDPVLMRALGCHQKNSPQGASEASYVWISTPLVILAHGLNVLALTRIRKSLPALLRRRVSPINPDSRLFSTWATLWAAISLQLA